VTIRTLAAKGMYDFCLDTVELLGCSETIDWSRTGEGLMIRLPEGISEDYPICFKIRLA
jgi:hypothetical protein